MLSRLIYSSHALCTAEEAQRLCIDARAFNLRSEITGALFLADKMFFQYLEGSELAISALYARIQRDPRHCDCRLLDSRMIPLRVFKGWSMTWLPNTFDTNVILQAVVLRDRTLATIDGLIAATMFRTLSQSAEHR